ncbi:hypothetical protein Tco_0516472 [Tanacetum coccineum]
MEGGCIRLRKKEIETPTPSPHEERGIYRLLLEYEYVVMSLAVLDLRFSNLKCSLSKMDTSRDVNDDFRYSHLLFLDSNFSS